MQGFAFEKLLFSLTENANKIVSVVILKYKLNILDCQIPVTQLINDLNGCQRSILLTHAMPILKGEPKMFVCQ